jgi:WD40 repeat protein
MYVVSIGYDDYAVRIWDRENGALVGEAASPSRPTDMVVHPRTQEIIVANVDGDVLVYPFSMLSGLGEPREWADAAGPSGRLALSSDGKTLATSSFNSPARLWNFPDGGSRKNLSDSESLRGLAFSPKGNLLAAGTMGNAFVVWDLEANGPFGRREVKIPSVGEKSDVWSVAVSPDGRKLLTGHMDSSITLWDLKSRKQIHNTYVRDASTFSVAFSPDGTLFASAQANGKVYLWDTESVQRLRGLEAHTGAATTVAFSPAEWEILASGGEDGRIVIWE